MSRSDRMPSRWWLVMTSTAPIRRSARTLIAADSLAEGSTLRMLWPLESRIARTVIVASRKPIASASGRGFLVLSLQPTVQRRFRSVARIWCASRRSAPSSSDLSGDARGSLKKSAMMDQIAPAGKARRSAAIGQIGRRYIGAVATVAWDRVEQRKQQQAREKTADMRLPGDADILGTDRDRPRSEYDVDAEPDRQESHHAGIAQGAQQRQRRYLRRRVGAAAAQRQEAATNEGEPDRR